MIQWSRTVVDAALAALTIDANEESRRAAAQGLVDLFGTALERSEPGSSP